MGGGKSELVGFGVVLDGLCRLSGFGRNAGQLHVITTPITAPLFCGRFSLGGSRDPTLTVKFLEREGSAAGESVESHCVLYLYSN